MKPATAVRRLVGSPFRMAAVAGIAAALVVAGVAYASIPDGSGVIHACYDARGALRVIDSATTTCAKNETSLTWNQAGPPGPAGPSNAFSSGVSGIVAFSAPPLSTLEQSLSLAPGKYSVTGQTIVNNAGVGDEAFTCTLSDNGTLGDQANVTVSAGGYATPALQGTTTFTGPGTDNVELVCRNALGTPGDQAFEGVINAIEVEHINGS